MAKIGKDDKSLENLFYARSFLIERSCILLPSMNGDLSVGVIAMFTR